MTVKAILRDRGRVVLETVCRVDGKVVVDGEATVKATSWARRNAPVTTEVELSPAQ